MKIPFMQSFLNNSSHNSEIVDRILVPIKIESRTFSNKSATEEPIFPYNRPMLSYQGYIA